MEPFNTVLIVDDDATAHFLIARILRRLRLAFSQQILTAYNGIEALQVLQQVGSAAACPELILLDINMPLLDGFEFLEALQGSSLIPTSTKIILLSSSSNPRDVERAKKYPVSGYVTKPLTEDILKTILN